MISTTVGPQRLYLMQVATMLAGPLMLPVPCYLVQMGDGKNILIDTGLALAPAGTEIIQEDSLGRGLGLRYGQSVIEQLATLGVQPEDVDLLISTHYDEDHAGNLGAFPRAQIVVQRLLHEVAIAGHPRFEKTRSQWDQPASRFRFVEGIQNCFQAWS